MSQKTLPDLAPLIQPLLGHAYHDLQCRPLVALLFHQGFGLDLSVPGLDLNQYFQEMWYQGDLRNPLDIVQAWDLVILVHDMTLPISQHVGLAVDTERFIHARDVETGAALGRLRTWKPRLLQLARYRELL